MSSKKTATPKATKLKIKAPAFHQKDTHQKACSHLRYDPAYVIPQKENREPTPQDWEDASAYADLPMTSASGRCYQRCAKCGHTRYTPGHEMPAPDPETVYHPPVIAAEPVNLFDLAAFPMTKEAQAKEQRKQELAARKAKQDAINAQHKQK
jgi:hypothetical protein